MIFSDETQSKKLKVIADDMRLTKKGSLKIRASQPEYPDAEPGWMTFNPREVEQIKRVLKIK